MSVRSQRAHAARLALFLLLLARPWWAMAQEAWSREQFMSENGLLQNRVHVMVRDGWGALLIGTEGGLVRFDGNHFKQIGLPANEGIRPARVLDILPTSGGAYVVRDAGCRQYVYADDELAPITADAPTRQYSSRFSGGMPSVEIGVRAMDPDSAIAGKSEWPSIVRPVPFDGQRWCMRSEKELLIYDGLELTSRHPLPEGRSSHLFALKDDIFTLGVDGRAYRVDPRSGAAVPVGMQDFPAVELRNNQLGWRVFWDPAQRTAAIIANERLYILRSEAKGQVLRAEPVDLQLPPDAKVGSLLWLHGEDVLAIGTDTKGLFIYRRNTMRSLLCDFTQDAVNNAYNAQAPYGRNGVLTSARSGSRVFTPEGCVPNGAPIKGFDETAIILDAGQRYWYGRHDTLFQYDAITMEERVLQRGVRPLCFLEEGTTMWVGTAKGIYKSTGDELRLEHPLSEGDLSSRPNALCRTANGELWMATCSGVYRTTTSGGWEAVPGLGSICARALTVIDGAVLVGSYGSGAFMVRPDGLFHLPPDQQGFLSHVHGFMPDSTGFLWMSTNQGLFRARWQDIREWTSDTTQLIHYAYYGKRAGIQNSEFNGGCSPPYVRTSGGWASFPTMDGLVWFRPESIPDAYPSGGVMVENVLVDGVPIGDDLLVRWDHRDVEIRFSLAYWGDPENVRLEYRLDGLTGDQWIPLSSGQRQLRFTQLPAGEPVLRVRKIGAGLRGEAPIELRFKVPAPFYRTVWFISACVLGGVLLFLSVIRLNAARLRRKNLQLEGKVRERTRELLEVNTDLRRTLEMKEMLVSIISHDIVTPLRFIARVANGASRSTPDQVGERLHGTLSDLARSSEKLHTNAQDLLHWIKRQDGRIDLRPRSTAMNPLVESILDMERERASEQGVALTNEVPLDDVLNTDRNVLSIVLHNLVANAVTHTPKGHVRVQAATEGDTYVLTVSDSGKGMPEAALRHAQRVQHKGALGAMNEEGERDVQGLGLLIVADLLELLGGRFTVHSEQGTGTTITLKFPMVHVPSKVQAT